MQGSTITDEQIETIRMSYALTGRYSAAAKAAGCSESTARKYAKSSDEFAELRAEKKAATIERVIEAMGDAQLRLIEALVDNNRLTRATMQEVATAVGILTDKRQLLSGQATNRTEHVASDAAARLTPEEMEQAARIRERLASEVGR